MHSLMGIPKSFETFSTERSFVIVRIFFDFAFALDFEVEFEFEFEFEVEVEVEFDAEFEFEFKPKLEFKSKIQTCAGFPVSTLQIDCTSRRRRRRRNWGNWGNWGKSHLLEGFLDFLIASLQRSAIRRASKQLRKLILRFRLRSQPLQADSRGFLRLRR